MPRVLHIDANNQRVRMTQSNGLADLQRLVGGSITIACHLADEYVLFVDDEGLFKPQQWFFRLFGQERPYAGNGVIVGPERYDDEGEYVGSDDVPLYWLHAVCDAVEFLDRAYIDSWVKATASEPEMTITNMDTGEVEVIACRGSVWGDMPRPEVREERPDE